MAAMAAPGTRHRAAHLRATSFSLQSLSDTWVPAPTLGLGQIPKGCDATQEYTEWYESPGHDSNRNITLWSSAPVAGSRPGLQGCATPPVPSSAPAAGSRRGPLGCALTTGTLERCNVLILMQVPAPQWIAMPQTPCSPHSIQIRSTNNRKALRIGSAISRTAART